MSLRDDVQRKEHKLYIAFKRLKNFDTMVRTRAVCCCTPDVG